MSRRGSPYENARAERFMRTLKEEEVQGRSYENVEDAKRRIGEFLEETYNRQRLHSALHYLMPDEFEKSLKTVVSDGADGNGGNRNRFPTVPTGLGNPSGIPTLPTVPDTTDVNTITKIECYQFFFGDFVSPEGCSAKSYLCLRNNLLTMSPDRTKLSLAPQVGCEPTTLRLTVRFELISELLAVTISH